MVVRKTCLPMSFLNLAVLFINFVSFSLDDVSDLSVEKTWLAKRKFQCSVILNTHQFEENNIRRLAKAEQVTPNLWCTMVCMQSFCVGVKQIMGPCILNLPA